MAFRGWYSHWQEKTRSPSSRSGGGSTVQAPHWHDVAPRWKAWAAAAGAASESLNFFFVKASLSIEHPLRTPPPDKPWARPTRTRVRTVHSAILQLAGVLHGQNLLRAPHKHLQRLCEIWSLVVRRITSEVAAVQQPGRLQPSHLCLSLACPSSAADAGYRLANS